MTTSQPVAVTPQLREQIKKLHPEIKQRLNAHIQRKAGHVARDVEIDRKDGGSRR